jgi:hypothetical protein
MKSAARSTAIVSSLFPSNVRERLYQEQEDKASRHRAGNLKSYLRSGGEKDGKVDSVDSQFSSKPLADLFTETTVMVGNVGFVMRMMITRE